ncbi:RNA polymerase sigma factor [Nocardioides sp.]|uniref:RNA polymerase sigma factor n=1 Tax=Nocardioides sp. TaxID=35761 RepID=UPI00273434F5|nr:sigma-70 family RNA polymerase sigma factor [Nocardioides sp.]MDP3893588.1 sigma-70 family RNA polymerase sigma factor [Nocardioides sp.]
MDAEQFEECWHTHIRHVVAYAERHVGRDAAYDIASATFLTAWRSWDVVPSEPVPWLISVAHGHVRNHHRSRRRRGTLEQRLALLDKASYAGPDASVTATQRAEALAVLAAMPEADREALLLVAWEGLTTAQAAEVLGCRAGTLRMRLHRARARIEASPDLFSPLTRSAQ